MTENINNFDISTLENNEFDFPELNEVFEDINSEIKFDERISLIELSGLLKNEIENILIYQTTMQQGIQLAIQQVEDKRHEWLESGPVVTTSENALKFVLLFFETVLVVLPLLKGAFVYIRSGRAFADSLTKIKNLRKLKKNSVNNDIEIISIKINQSKRAADLKASDITLLREKRDSLNDYLNRKILLSPSSTREIKKLETQYKKITSKIKSKKREHKKHMQEYESSKKQYAHSKEKYFKVEIPSESRNEAMKMRDSYENFIVSMDKFEDGISIISSFTKVAKSTQKIGEIKSSSINSDFRGGDTLLVTLRSQADDYFNAHKGVLVYLKDQIDLILQLALVENYRRVDTFAVFVEMHKILSTQTIHHNELSKLRNNVKMKFEQLIWSIILKKFLYVAEYTDVAGTPSIYDLESDNQEEIDEYNRGGYSGGIPDAVIDVPNLEGNDIPDAQIAEDSIITNDVLRETTANGKEKARHLIMYLKDRFFYSDTDLKKLDILSDSAQKIVVKKMDKYLKDFESTDKNNSFKIEFFLDSLKPRKSPETADVSNVGSSEQ